MRGAFSPFSLSAIVAQGKPAFNTVFSSRVALRQLSFDRFFAIMLKRKAEKNKQRKCPKTIRVFFKGLESALFHDGATPNQHVVDLDVPLSGQVDTLENNDVPLIVSLESQSVKSKPKPGTLDISDGTLEEKPDTLELQNDTLAKADTLADTLGISDDTLASRLIALIRKNPQITQVEMVDKLSCSIPTVKRITKRLSEKGIITRKGGKRYGYWEVL